MSSRVGAEIIANAVIRAGVCVEEAEKAKAAIATYDAACDGYESAVDNAAAGGATATSTVIGSAFCLLGGPTPVTAGCLVVFGLGTMGGIWWTSSGVKGMLAAEKALNDADAGFEAAWTELCKCVRKHRH